MEKKLARIKQLVKDINMYNQYYYTLDNPIISDSQWDALYDELVALENETGVVLENSPTAKVGGDVIEGFKKVRHVKKLYSLDKCSDQQGLNKWFTDMQKAGADDFTLEYKYDGLRIALTYNGGNLELAATRGNGTVGEDVTAQVKTISSVPKTIKYQGRVVVAGEAVMRKSVLKAFNESATELLKNERNAAAGAIRNLDTNVTRQRNLDLYIYDIIDIDDAFLQTHSQEREFLIENGFSVFDYFHCSSNTSALIAEIAKTDDARHQLDVLVDGLVFKVNNVALREKIGSTNKFPKWAIAYKFKAEEVTTKLLDVVWQVGRTGKITPIAQIQPVELAGATVRRATLNNYGDILRKEVKLNSIVFVRRSNEVIPEILGVAEHTPQSKEIEKPSTCPSCSLKLSEVGANLFCTNNQCTDKVEEQLVHFASKNGMNIDGMSVKTIQKLRQRFEVNNISDIYLLTKDQLLQLDNFKEKKASNLIKAINKSKDVNFANFIFALGINEVGDKTAHDLSVFFASLSELAKATTEQLLNVEMVGEIIADNIQRYFNNPENVQQIQNLLDSGVKINYPSAQTIENPNILGKTFVLTGTLENYTRDEASKIIQQHGGKVSGSVSKNTNYLLAGENAGSKLQKAIELNVEVITEKDFSSLIK